MSFASFTRSLVWESHLALRYLRSKKQDGFLSVITGFSFLGICLGVATLIIVMSVMGGFREELLGRIIGMKGHALVYSSGSAGLADDPDLYERIAQVAHVTKVCPMIERQSVITNAVQTRGTLVLGLAWEDLEKNTMLYQGLLPPSPDEGLNVEQIKSEFEGDVVLVGKRMAELMGLTPGDTVSLMDPQGEVTPFGTVPKQREFRIIGLFEVGMSEYDKNIVILPKATAQEFFDLEGRVTQLEIFTDNIDRNDTVVRAIARRLPPPLTVLGWKHGDSNFFQAVQIERNVMFLILTLIVFIASFNIISGLVMLVKDKRHDIAILKTVGASRFSVMRIFIMVGSAIGCLGTLIGVVLGVVVTLNLNAIVNFIQTILRTKLFNPEVYFLSALPYKLNLHEIAAISAMAIILSVLAALYPSFRAARLDPAVTFKKG